MPRKLERSPIRLWSARSSGEARLKADAGWALGLALVAEGDQVQAEHELRNAHALATSAGLVREAAARTTEERVHAHHETALGRKEQLEELTEMWGDAAALAKVPDTVAREAGERLARLDGGDAALRSQSWIGHLI